jgi:hypothetical protein
MTRKLVIISGPDRIGKSTLCQELRSQVGADNCKIIHLAEPPLDQDDPYDINRDKIQKWVRSGKEWCFFDRSYPCSMIFEEHRRGNAGHLSHIVELEIELMRCVDTFEVVHVVYDRSWHWSAKHHLAEIDGLFPNAADWAKRDKYIARMREHRLYYERIADFMEHVTAFPHEWHVARKDVDVDAMQIIAGVEELLK